MEREIGIPSAGNPAKRRPEIRTIKKRRWNERLCRVWIHVADHTRRAAAAGVRV